MREYSELAANTLTTGFHKSNRTGIDTISAPIPQQYHVDLQDGYPLLTTKQMNTFRWDSMVEETCWYLDGTHHIRDLDTKVWDAWADENGNLPTAYGRFWRYFPIPEKKGMLPGEWWATNVAEWVDEAVELYATTEEEIVNAIDRWVTVHEVTDPETGETTTRRTFDQIQQMVDTLNGENPMRSPNSRRLMVSPWNPGNAGVSKLPPCHCFWGVTLINGKLNLHLTQRSGDIALGIPFNIAAYCLLLKVIAQETGYEPGVFSHSILDAHIYCGLGERGEWYEQNLPELKNRVNAAMNSPNQSEHLHDIRSWILNNAPEDEGATNPENSEYGYDHVPGLLEQIAREPYSSPELHIKDKSINNLSEDDVSLRNYEYHPGLKFKVAV